MYQLKLESVPTVITVPSAGTVGDLIINIITLGELLIGVLPSTLSRTDIVINDKSLYSYEMCKPLSELDIKDGDEIEIVQLTGNSNKGEYFTPLFVYVYVKTYTTGVHIDKYRTALNLLTEIQTGRA